MGLGDSVIPSAISEEPRIANDDNTLEQCLICGRKILEEAGADGYSIIPLHVVRMDNAFLITEKSRFISRGWLQAMDTGRTLWANSLISF